MTRAEWYQHWRELRIEKRKNTPAITLDSRVMIRALRSVYNYIYTPTQTVFIHLFYRYKRTMPLASAVQKAKRIHSWRPAAREEAKRLMKDLLLRPNPLLALMPPDRGSWGAYIPVPVFPETKET